MFCAGQVYVTGRAITSSTIDNDAGNVSYSLTNTAFQPESAIIHAGTGSISLSEVLTSDNDYAEIGADLDNDLYYPVMVLFGADGMQGASELCFEIESKGSENGIIQYIFARNWVSGGYDLIDSSYLNLFDQVAHAAIKNNPAAYIDSNGLVNVQVRYEANGADLSSWGVYIDKVAWKAKF